MKQNSVPQTLQLFMGDCKDKMQSFDENSIGNIICDPPYGLSFMNKKWDNLDEWKSGAGMSKPGIGQRELEWPSLGGTQPFGGANPTCSTCGGRLRGVKKCTCDEPEWVVAGEPVGDGTDAALNISLDNIHTQQAWHLNWLVEAFRVMKPGGVIKAFGGTRTFHRLAAAMEQAGFEDIHLDAWIYGSGFPKSLNISKSLQKKMDNNDQTTPVDQELVEKFSAYGTALKPAWEPFIVGRKP